MTVQVIEDDENIDTAAVSRAAETPGDKTAAPVTDDKPKTAVEFVRERREQMRARSGATTPTDATKPDGKAAPAKAGDAAAAGDKAKEPPAAAAATSAEPYSDDELAEIVESGKDLRNVDLKRVPPALKATLAKMQTAERKRNEKLTTKERELEDRLKRLEQAATAASPKKSEEDDDENELPDAEYDAIFKTKKGKEKLAAALKEYGVDPEELKAVKEERSVAQQKSTVNGAIFMAQKSHPELKEDAYFDRVITAIEEDEDWTKAFEANRNNATVMASVLKAATLHVKLQDAMKDKTEVAKGIETIKREKEKQNAKPGSKAAAASTSARPSKDMSTVDFVRNRRAQIRGQA